MLLSVALWQSVVYLVIGSASGTQKNVFKTSGRRSIDISRVANIRDKFAVYISAVRGIRTINCIVIID